MSDSTIVPSTPDPTTTTIILSLARSLLTIAGAAGMPAAAAWLNNPELPVIASALAMIAGVVWSLYQKYQAARANHANTLASLDAGRAVIVKAVP